MTIHDVEVEVTFGLEELLELRKTVSISMSKLEQKIGSTDAGSPPNLLALKSYHTLGRVADLVSDGIKAGLG